MEQNNFEAFKEADIRICNLLPKKNNDLITPVRHSIEFSYLPPLFAERLNIYAEKGHTVFAEKPLEFYFSALQENAYEETIEKIRNDIMAIVLPHSQPSVCVFIHPTIAHKLVTLINEPSIVCYWNKRLLGRQSRLYDIYLDDNNHPRAKLIHLFCNN
jgi:hypothetical protein